MSTNRLVEAKQLLSRLRQQDLACETGHELQKIVADRFPELDLFRQQLGKDVARELIPYTIRKNSVMIYRAIFALVGVMFFVLAYLVHSMIPTATCHLFFHNCFILQSALKFFCVTGALGAFTFSVYLRAEFEAWKKIVGKAKNRLANSYAEKQIRLERYPFQAYNEQRLARKKLEENHEKASQALRLKGQETKHLLIKIGSTRKISSIDREKLFNQALAELQEEIDQLKV